MGKKSSILLEQNPQFVNLFSIPQKLYLTSNKNTEIEIEGTQVFSIGLLFAHEFFFLLTMAAPNKTLVAKNITSRPLICLLETSYFWNKSKCALDNVLKKTLIAK